MGIFVLITLCIFCLIMIIMAFVVVADWDDTPADWWAILLVFCLMSISIIAIVFQSLSLAS